MTTSPVMTVTDELLAEIEEAASNATQYAWELLPGTNLSGPEVVANGESIAWVLNSEADAVHIALANPATIAVLTTELRRLRAENAELAKDAGRYRLIRSEGIPDPAIAMVDSYYGELELVAPNLLDAAIDTAMATHRGEA